MPDAMKMLGLGNTAPILKPNPISPTEKSDGPTFESTFADAIERVDQFRMDAQDAAGRFMRGENEEVHQVAMAVQRSELAFETFLQVRNKVVNAYQEIMRMQL